MSGLGPSTLLVTTTRHMRSIGLRPGANGPHLYVIQPGTILAGRRFDVIIVHDACMRDVYRDSPQAQRLHDWIEECVRCRLSGPDAVMVKC